MKKYPTGMCALKQVIFNFAFTIFMIASIITVPLIVMLVLKAELWVTLLTIMGLTLGLSLIYLIVNALMNPIPKILTSFAFDLNYDQFEKRMNSILEEKINAETKSLVLLLKCNILSAINLKESQNLFETIQEPSSKKNKSLYELIQIYYFINRGDEIKAKELFTSFKTKYPKNKSLLSIETTMKVIFTDEAIENIEKIMPTNLGSLFDNLSNVNLLLHYYDKQEDYEKALIYTKMILEKDTCLNEYNQSAKDFIQKYENNNVVKESI